MIVIAAVLLGVIRKRRRGHEQVGGTGLDR